MLAPHSFLVKLATHRAHRATVSLQNENVRFEQSRNVRFHRVAGGARCPKCRNPQCQAPELYASRHAFPVYSAFRGEWECLTEKLALALDSQVECGFAAERKALCEPLDSSFVFLP